MLNLDAQIPERSSNGDKVMTTTQKILLDKHPLGKPPNPTTLMTDPPGMVNPIIFEGLDADSICSASLHTLLVLLIFLGWMPMRGIACAAASSLLLLLCALLWLLWDVVCTESVHPT